jgi:hypothetical protein
MTETTFDRRLSQLIDQVSRHPHKDELLQLAQDQLMDDTDVLHCIAMRDLVEAY